MMMFPLIQKGAIVCETPTQYTGDPWSKEEIPLLATITLSISFTE
ncbi:MAG: hypothetical protein P0S93_04700 [Candidatus Neptunochlamydia sp.]|nr:hypothetical protein [Candidatus Neptunochlamydia sp.]